MSDKLLDGARSLEALLETSDARLPSVPRSLHQIREDARSLVHRQRAAPLDSETSLFLASQGIATAEIDPRRVDLERAEQGPAAWSELDDCDDMDDFVARSREALLDMAVANAMSSAEYEHDEVWRQHEDAEWEKEKPRLLEALRQQVGSADRDEARAPAAREQNGGAANAPPAAAGVSLRSLRGQKYAAVISAALEQVGARGVTAAPPLFFITKLADAVAGLKAEATGKDKGLDASALEMLSACWQLLGHMARAAQPFVRPSGPGSGTSADISPYLSKDIRLRCALIRGTLRQLGEQQSKALRSKLRDTMAEAQRGGERGLEYDAAAFVRLQTTALDVRDEVVQLGDSNRLPLWQVVYWCMRCDDIAAAVRVMERGRGHQMIAWEKLLQLAHVVADDKVALHAQAVRQAQEEYWSHGAKMDEYLRVVYSVLAAPEPMVDLYGEDGLLPSRHVTNEDYLWHRLSVTLSSMSVATSLAFSERGGIAAGSLSGADPLQAFQTTLYETYGEDHFNKNRHTPLLFFSVLLHSQQFERALAFLFSVPVYAEDAVHFAIALQHEGLLATVPRAQQGADGGLLVHTDSPRLCLDAMVSRYVRNWAAEAGGVALQYVWMLRGTAHEREMLAVDVLLRSGVPEVLLQPLPFIEPQSKRRVMCTLAMKIRSELGLVKQAARLLYEAEDYPALCELLVSEISTQIIQSPRLNPSAGAVAAKLDAAEVAASEARFTQLRKDATAFLTHWLATGSADAFQGSEALQHALSIAELMYVAASWRQQRREGRSEFELSKLIEALERLPLLPAEPAAVEEAQADFRLLPPSLQRCFPPLIEAAIEALHAKLMLLTRGAPSQRHQEVHALRSRAEAIVAFSNIAVWAAAEASGEMHMPAATLQRLASWLADMA